jgi:hypothetical protein
VVETKSLCSWSIHPPPPADPSAFPFLNFSIKGSVRLGNSVVQFATLFGIKRRFKFAFDVERRPFTASSAGSVKAAGRWEHSVELAATAWCWYEYSPYRAVNTFCLSLVLRTLRSHSEGASDRRNMQIDSPQICRERSA